MSEGGETPEFNWDALVPLIVHPVKVAILEALLWVGKPLSATDLTKLFHDNKGHYLAIVSYHAVNLGKVKAIKVTRKRKVRGATEKFYSIPSKMLR